MITSIFISFYNLHFTSDHQYFHFISQFTFNTIQRQILCSTRPSFSRPYSLLSSPLLSLPQLFLPLLPVPKFSHLSSFYYPHPHYPHFYRLFPPLSLSSINLSLSLFSILLFIPFPESSLFCLSLLY